MHNTYSKLKEPIMTVEKPTLKPNNPNFSSGPCSKRPGWTIGALSNALTGRSHRSSEGKAKLKDIIEMHRDILGIPSDYKIAIVPASDTGAVEMVLWSMIGARPVDVFAWEAFSTDWLKDIRDHLKINDVNGYTAPYGELPDLSLYNGGNDCVFAWNGTTSGVRVPNGDWIADDRTGLTICDATSAVFAYDMPWDKLDVTTWSWQKVLGGEAAHGMVVLSPRAVERLESFTPDRPLPKIFRMTKNGKLNDALFQGATINTPSMIAVEDCLDALKWVESVGGLNATITRAQNNFDALNTWVENTPWVNFLAHDAKQRSTTSVCLTLSGDIDIKAMTKLLDQENVAKDINAYRDAPPGLRIWCGATIETTDIRDPIPWLEWAYDQIMTDNDS
jgi:phosphoserine aminotransferase